MARSSGGSRPRRKGIRGEREIVNKLKEAGLDAERMPLSGAAGGSFSGDIVIRYEGEELRGEVKRKNEGFKLIYKWLEGNDLLLLRSDRREWLVVVRLDDYLKLLRERKGGREVEE